MAKPLLISCLKDIKTDSCGPLTTQNSERDLILSLQQFVEQHPESLPAKHPHDFTILVSGYYNQDTGEVISQNPPTVMGTLFDVLPSNQRATVVSKQAKQPKILKKKK